MTSIHWFRRDLRLRDNPALDTALRTSGGHVVPLFILDDAIIARRATGTARIAFLLDTLCRLDADLRARGSRLVLRRGDPLVILRELAGDSEIDTVTWNRDYTPYARRRDTAAEEVLRSMGIAVHTERDAAIVEPGTIVSGAGTPYSVYTPFARTWRAYLAANPPPTTAPTPAFAPVPETLVGEPIPTSATLGLIIDQGPLPPGGEAAGYERLSRFTSPGGAIIGYQTQRDLPAVAGTSQLSAYLRFGCVAPAAALRAAQYAADRDGAAGAQQWIGELAWRDFYIHIVYHFPHVLRSAFRPQYDAIAWENDEDLFAAWCEGRTGYPIVDAAMRQLQREAWMHNRCRMIVASFLTKDLLIDWRWGEHYFMQQLVDGDPAANNGGWQWAAGTGTDAQPYFRIFNPTSQGEKFDPQGEYIRRYVPELRNVPARYIHSPWKMPPDEQRRAHVHIGRDYPAPIVDHAQRRIAALAMYRAVR